MKYKIWNKQDTLYAPNGDSFTKEQIFAQHPLAAVDGVDFIICDAPISMGVFMEYTQTKDIYKKMGAKILDEMKMVDVLKGISEFEENPPEREPAVEERTASALEALVMLNMIDESVEEK